MKSKRFFENMAPPRVRCFFRSISSILYFKALGRSKHMKMRFPTFLSVATVLAVSAICAGAQSNTAIDRLLAEDKATVADAAYLILTASKIVTESAAPEKVMAALSERKLLQGTRSAADPISLGEVSFLIMQTLGIRGGVLYAVFPGPRYAARELAYLRIIPGNTHPSRTVSGQEVMHILGGALEMKGGAK
jgi:hypothetical protein